jgi:hypothetical protein
MEINNMNNDELIKGKRGRPRLGEVETPKLWENKEHIASYNKIYYQKNKNKYQLSRDEITCECGATILKTSKAHHVKGKSHIKIISEKNI